MIEVRAALAAALLLSACSAPPAKGPEYAGRYNNACLPEAIGMVQGLKGAGIQGKVLTVRTPSWGHALAVYLYPPGQNRLWCWDSRWKSIEVKAFYSNPDQVAAGWMRRTAHSESVLAADFLE